MAPLTERHASGVILIIYFSAKQCLSLIDKLFLYWHIDSEQCFLSLSFPSSCFMACKHSDHLGVSHMLSIIALSSMDLVALRVLRQHEALCCRNKTVFFFPALMVKLHSWILEAVWKSQLTSFLQRLRSHLTLFIAHASSRHASCTDNWAAVSWSAPWNVIKTSWNSKYACPELRWLCQTVYIFWMILFQETLCWRIIRSHTVWLPLIHKMQSEHSLQGFYPAFSLWSPIRCSKAELVTPTWKLPL